MGRAEADSDELLDNASHGDEQAQHALFARHRARLKRMVALRLDRRLAARLDPSDVVQEVYVMAHQRLAKYLVDRPIPFYAWLRQLAVERLNKLHEWHVRTQKRHIGREALQIPEDSAADLAKRLVAIGRSPSEQAQRRELHMRVQAGLLQLREIDREVLLLRFVEQLSIHEIAAVLEISEVAVKVRQYRALQRLKKQLDDLVDEVGK